MARAHLLSAWAAMVAAAVAGVGCRQLAELEPKSECTDGADCMTPPNECVEGCDARGGCRAAEGKSCGADGRGTCSSNGVCFGSDVTLSAMRQNTCARMHDGLVWCWGANKYGQIGAGDVVQRSGPTRVRWLPRAKQVFVGYWHACAIVGEGDVFCWGRNETGQLGTGRASAENGTVARRVRGLPPVVDLAVGEHHTCALDANGDVFCWGDNTLAQVAPSDEAMIVKPTRVALRGVTKISSAKNHTCAILDEAPWLSCWGWNLQRQLGPGAGDLVTSANPVAVELPSRTRVTDVVATHRSTCAVSDRSVYCWGYNARGQLGNGKTIGEGSIYVPAGDKEPPKAAEPAPGIVYKWVAEAPAPMPYVDSFVPTDGSHLCVRTSLRTEERVLCWGGDDRGELGRGKASYDDGYARPAGVLDEHVRAMASGEDHVCAAFAPPGTEPWIGCYGGAPWTGTGSADPDDAAHAITSPRRVSWPLPAR